MYSRGQKMKMSIKIKSGEEAAKCGLITMDNGLLKALIGFPLHFDLQFQKMHLDH